MTALDPGSAQATIPSQVPPGAAAAPAAMLPRDPQERLAALFDPGTLEVLPVGLEERCGVMAGVGLIHGAGAVAFASDPRVQGGAMGTAGCAAIVAAYSEALARGVRGDRRGLHRGYGTGRPDRGAVAFRWRPAG